jgi:hypothetical protein
VLRQELESKELHIQWIQVDISPEVTRPDREAKRSPQYTAKVRKIEALPPFLHTPSRHAQGEIYFFKFQVIQNRDVIRQLVCLFNNAIIK